MDTEDFTSPTLDQTSAGNDEGARADFRTGGEVETQGGWVEDKKEGRGGWGEAGEVGMAYYRAKTMLSVPSGGAQTHLISPTATKSFRLFLLKNCIYSLKNSLFSLLFNFITGVCNHRADR